MDTVQMMIAHGFDRPRFVLAVQTSPVALLKMRQFCEGEVAAQREGRLWATTDYAERIYRDAVEAIGAYDYSDATPQNWM